MTTEIDARRRSDSWDGSKHYLMWFLSKVMELASSQFLRHRFLHPHEEIDESPNSRKISTGKKQPLKVGCCFSSNSQDDAPSSSFQGLLRALSTCNDIVA